MVCLAETLAPIPLAPCEAEDLGDFRMDLRRAARITRSRPALRHSAEVTLLRQWYASFLHRYEHISLQVVGEEGGRHLQAFQILDVERRSIIARAYLDADDQAELEGLYVASMQPLELWHGGATAEAAAERPSALQAFVLLEPMKVDIIAACGVSLQSRAGVLAWQSRMSDIEGCTELFGSERLVDRRVDLLGKQVPVLCLLDALGGRGFTGIAEIVRHSAGCKYFDNRRICGRRAYLQCVLHQEALQAKGVLEFRSTGPNSYFDALLRSKKSVRLGLTALEYKKMIAMEDGDELAIAALTAQASRQDDRGTTWRREPLPHTAPLVPLPPVPAQEGSSDESVVGVGKSDASSGGGGLGDVAIPPVSEAASVQSVVGAAESQAPSQRGGSFPIGVAATILGVPVQFVRGRRTATHMYADRIGVRCCSADHPACRKSRSLELMKSRFGVRCAEAFLGAWLTKAGAMAAGAHAKYNPAVTDMEAYLALHP